MVFGDLTINHSDDRITVLVGNVVVWSGTIGEWSDAISHVRVW